MKKLIKLFLFLLLFSLVFSSCGIKDPCPNYTNLINNSDKLS